MVELGNLLTTILARREVLILKKEELKMRRYYSLRVEREGIKCQEIKLQVLFH